MAEKKVKGSIKVIGDAVYEIVPTEKGYAYVICAALILTIISCMSHVSSFGMLYNDFFKNVSGGVEGMSTVMGVAAGMMAVSGVITTIALKKLSLRQIGLFGAILYTLGWFFNSFVTSINQMIITYSIMLSIGQGILITVTFTIFNTYFNESKLTVLSLCQVFIGSAAIVFPLFVKYSLNEYGFRGTVMIISALFSHTIFAVVCYHPVEWHSKWKLLYRTVVRDENTPNKRTEEIEPIANLEPNDEEISLKIINAKFNVKEIANKSSFPHPKNGETDEFLEKPQQEQNKGFMKTILNFFDLIILKDIVFINILFGMALGTFTDYSFYIFFPSYLFEIGLGKSEVATSLALLAITDLIARGFLVVFSKFYKIRSRHLYFIGVAGSSFFRILFLQSASYWYVLLMTAAMGFFRPFITITLSLVYAEYIPEKFTTAFAIYLLTSGAANLTLLPIIGYIRYKTESFIVMFYIIVLCALPCLIPWTIEYWYFKNRRTLK